MRIVLPDEEMQLLLAWVREHTGLRQLDEDWCELKREKDNAYADIYPEKPPPDRKVFRWS